MPAGTRRAIAMFTDFFAAADLEATARRTGFVQRTSKITGTLLLALVPVGTGREGQTTLAHLAAKGTPWCQPGAVSPEAMHQRMHKKALAFLQDMLRQVLATLPSLTPVGDAGLFAALHKGYMADSTGFALPDDLHTPVPGAGGSAAKAGATMQAVWDDTRSLLDHFALTPWNLPDQRDVATVVALARKGIVFLFAVGYCQVKALASLAPAGAAFCCRLHHQTTLDDTVAGHGAPVSLEAYLRTVAPDRLRLETALFLGATARVAARLRAVRRPAAGVNARRRMARKNAKHKGAPPSPAHLTLRAWHLLMTHVPATIGTWVTVPTVDPRRWHIERIFQSWKSSLPLAALTPTKAASPVGSLSGRRRRMLWQYALGPQTRATLGLQDQRALSRLQFARPFHALAASWLQAIFPSACALYHFLPRACTTAERLAAKAVRQRRTTAQILCDRLQNQGETVVFMEAVSA